MIDFTTLVHRSPGRSELALLTMGLLLILSACEGQRPTRANVRPGSHKVQVVSSESGKKVDVWCEIAADPNRRRRSGGNPSTRCRRECRLALSPGRRSNHGLSSDGGPNSFCCLS